MFGLGRPFKNFKSFLLLTLMLVFTNVSFAALQKDREEALSAIASMPAPFGKVIDSAPVINLFSIHGSNTIGASLGPNMVMAYLRAKGAENIRIQPLAKPNEKLVMGELFDQGKTVQVKILAHGSSTGFKGLMSGEAQLWASSRPAKIKEVNKAKALEKSGFDLTSDSHENILAIDGVAIIAHPNNPIKELTTEQLAQLFAGEIKNWSELGGLNVPVKLFARDKFSGTWDSFKNMVLAKKYSLDGSAQRYEDSEELVNNVLANQGGIGFVGMGFVGASQLLAIRDGQAQSFKPSQLTLATEDYALSRRLYFYTSNQVNEYVNEFITFSEGVHGQQLVKQQGFVSQNVSSMNALLSDDLPQDYLSMVDGAKRLSVNFRFQPGSAKLDNKAIKDIQRLAYFIREQRAKLSEEQQLEFGRKLMLIGFGDKRRTAQRSKLLSKLRAMAVRRELARLGIYPGLVSGYGAYNPVASYEGSSGMKNRRVEVWLR